VRKEVLGKEVLLQLENVLWVPNANDPEPQQTDS